ncbi:hypothetical protein HY643_00995 [Candidatus Woesearchaeota archaeon]|nr:hypothetical protein [Candidatus Woesearchaeota archaeon]
MQYLVNQIVNKGIDSLDHSMLSEDLRNELFTKAGELFIKEGKHFEGVKCLAIAQNIAKLKEYGNYFVERILPEFAILCFIQLKDEDMIKKVGPACIDKGYYNIAIKAYEAIGDKKMAEFVRKNFLE